MKDINLCTVLVNSCDAYCDAWYPFFRLFSLYWPDCPYTIRLNTEKLTCDFEEIEIKTIRCLDDVSWSKRLKLALEYIDSKYIIFMMDDFFLNAYVNQNAIEQCISWLEEDKSNSLAAFHLCKDVGSERYFKERAAFSPYENFFEVRIGDAYRMSCTAAIWRKEKLIKYLRDHETPWELEEVGTKRIERFVDDKIYRYFGGRDIISYALDESSHRTGIFRGRWCVEAVDELFRSNNIHIDYTIRGTCGKRIPHTPFQIAKNGARKVLTGEIFRILYRRYLSLRK